MVSQREGIPAGQGAYCCAITPLRQAACPRQRLDSVVHAVASVAQTVLDLLEVVKEVLAASQCDPGGEDVDQGELHHPRRHGHVMIGVFRGADRQGFGALAEPGGNPGR